MYETPEILATIETAELIVDAFGGGSHCTPMGCH